MARLVLHSGNKCRFSWRSGRNVGGEAPLTLRGEILPMRDAATKLQTFTAVIRKAEGWWIGWEQEISGVNSQGKTRAELLKKLQSALREPSN